MKELVSSWLLTLLLVVIALVSILGNLLVCLAVKTDKNLRKLSNLFLVSLAIADLLVRVEDYFNLCILDNIYKVALFVMPFAIINDTTGEWPLGEKACQIWIRFAQFIMAMLVLTKHMASSDVMCSTASILSLCAISLDRYIKIKDPLQYTEWITRR